jgi:hypothetical protein
VSDEDRTATAIIPSVVRATGWRDGAFGAGLVLVFLPGAALVLFAKKLADTPIIGLPVLAIFGVMILFGALAMVATLFARLGLSNTAEALALPSGSVRAAIALALVVLFALISVMLYQSMAQHANTDDLIGLSDAERAKVIDVQAARLVSVTQNVCPDNTPPEAKCVTTYTVKLRGSQPPEAVDLAKQLLTLIGTLVASVVSYYFAARANEAVTKAAIGMLKDPKKPDDPTPPDSSPPDPNAVPAQAADDHTDGCNVPIENATDDADLPPATGGVAS